MYFDTPMRDDNSGLNITEAGCTTLDGEQALGFARARHLEYKDAKGKWKTDPTGDLGRITRQQIFMRKVIDQVGGQGHQPRHPGHQRPDQRRGQEHHGRQQLRARHHAGAGQGVQGLQRRPDGQPHRCRPRRGPPTAGPTCSSSTRPGPQPIFDLFKGTDADARRSSRPTSRCRCATAAASTARRPRPRASCRRWASSSRGTDTGTTVASATQVQYGIGRPGPGQPRGQAREGRRRAEGRQHAGRGRGAARAGQGLRRHRRRRRQGGRCPRPRARLDHHDGRPHDDHRPRSVTPRTAPPGVTCG